MSESLILTTGVYDLIKDHVKRRKATKEQEEILTDALRHATQVLRRDLPENVVSIDCHVKIKDLSTNQEIEGIFVAPDKAKVSKKKYSILSDMGLATIGKTVGETVHWPTNEGNKSYQILEAKHTL